jgi:thiol-disulfide isomerase/thioredoxin
LVAAQLQDCDPQICLLGLNYLNALDRAMGVPELIPVLDNPSPQVVARALKQLERWSDQKFGVKIAETVPTQYSAGLLKYPPGIVDKVKQGVAQAKSWWAQHQTEFGPAHLELPAAALVENPVPVADDFALRDLDGRTVRLSDFHGKVVLINFWTTWCTACVGELPELVALQDEHKNNLAILGVSLDFVPMDDGDGDVDTNATPAALRAKIARTATGHGIHYPVLLDEHNEVGGRFNGGELPTTIIVDAGGRIRRRFIGARNLPVFEAMIAEAAKPPGSRSLARQ